MQSHLGVAHGNHHRSIAIRRLTLETQFGSVHPDVVIIEPALLPSQSSWRRSLLFSAPPGGMAPQTAFCPCTASSATQSTKRSPLAMLPRTLCARRGGADQDTP